MGGTSASTWPLVSSIFFETGYVYLNDLGGKSASFPEDVTFGYISVIELRWDF